jgi:hypothetical protein
VRLEAPKRSGFSGAELAIIGVPRSHRSHLESLDELEGTFTKMGVAFDRMGPDETARRFPQVREPTVIWNVRYPIILPS